MTHAAAHPPELRVAIFGATGLAGGGVLRACLDEARVREVRAITRRPLELRDGRFTEVLCEDFAEPGDAVADALTGIDAVFFCLGISASKVNAADYRVITVDYGLAAARVLRTRSPGAVFHFISGAGTHRGSRMRWARVKAEAEMALGRLGLGGLVCWRPAVILASGALAELSPSQCATRLALAPLRWATSLSVSHVEIGEAMLQSVLDGRRKGTVENRELRMIADRYRTGPLA